MTLCVAAVQMTATADAASNMAYVQKSVRDAHARGAALVVLPENYGFLGPEQGKLAHAQDLDGPFVAPLRAIARELSIAIIAGGMPERAEATRVFNTCVCIGPTGEVIASYRKIHLFDVELTNHVSLKESATVVAGDTPVVCETLGWRIGLSVCYDLRFPELYRRLATLGAELIVVPAAFTSHTGKDHWEPLLRARAIENQCYVIAAGQFGLHGNGRQSWGKSMVIDPWGTPLAVAPERPSLAIAELSKSYMNQVREQLPALRHRRM